MRGGECHQHVVNVDKAAANTADGRLLPSTRVSTFKYDFRAGECACVRVKYDICKLLKSSSIVQILESWKYVLERAGSEFVSDP